MQRRRPKGFLSSLLDRFGVVRNYGPHGLQLAYLGAGRIITASNINWEIIRPGILGNEPVTGLYQVLTNLQKGMKVGRINRSDVADYLLREAVEPVNLKRKVTLI